MVVKASSLTPKVNPSDFTNQVLLAYNPTTKSWDGIGKDAIAPTSSTKTTRSATPPTSPKNGDIWDELDQTFQFLVVHRWVWITDKWYSYNLNYARCQFVVSPPSADTEKTRDLNVAIPFKSSRPITLLLTSLNASFTNYTTPQDASNFWTFLVYGTTLSEGEVYWFGLDTKTQAANTVANKELLVSTFTNPSTDFKRIRVEARATGNPGILIASLSLAHSYVCT